MRITASEKIDVIKDESEFKRFLVNFLTEIKLTINGNINFIDNFGAREVQVTFSESDTNTRVIVGGNKVPINYIIMGTTAAMNIYDGSFESKPGELYLRSSAVGTARILVL